MIMLEALEQAVRQIQEHSHMNQDIASTSPTHGEVQISRVLHVVMIMFLTLLKHRVGHLVI